MTFAEWWKEQPEDIGTRYPYQALKSLAENAWTAAISNVQALPLRKMFDSGYINGERKTAEQILEMVKLAAFEQSIRTEYGTGKFNAFTEIEAAIKEKFRLEI